MPRLGFQAEIRGRKLIAQNRKARHDYTIEDTYEAGLVLVGTEVKSLRAGRASLVDGYALVEDGEIWLRGVNIPVYNEGSWTNHEPTRPRKLLLNTREINKLHAAVARHCGGKRVLDAFCNQGAFALHAARAGASEVLGLDSAEDVHFLPKPFGLKQLVAKVKDVLSGAPPAPPANAVNEAGT